MAGSLFKNIDVSNITFCLPSPTKVPEEKALFFDVCGWTDGWMDGCVYFVNFPDI